MDLFKVLGCGARFDRKRFADDVSVFESSLVLPAGTCDDKGNRDLGNADSLLRELDVFANRSTSTNTKRKGGKNTEQSRRKKRKPGTPESTVVEAGGGDTETGDLFGPIFRNQQEVSEFRRKHRIRVYGADAPNPFQNFTQLFTHYHIPEYIRKNLELFGFRKPTPIQMQAVPIILAGREIIACAPTGSGKTLAFVLPILTALGDHQKVGYRALIISPTRELAKQIFNEFQRLGTRKGKGKALKLCMLTKATAATQAHASHLQQNYDVLITTPMRLVHALQHENIKLHMVEHLVLDEADRLLDLGFLEQVDEIIAACSNPKLQRSLFSATIPSGVESLATTVMQNPLRLVIGSKNAATDTINQKLLYVGQEEGKLVAIRQLVQGGLKPPVLIFVESIERAKELFHELVYDGINVDVIHSERTKAQRDAIVENFRLGKIWVLIATELMARGVDFKGVNMVINYDFPQTVQSYIHRIGRTGRAGRTGEAVTYFTQDDAPYLRMVVNVMKESGCDVPEWMLSMPKARKGKTTSVP